MTKPRLLLFFLTIFMMLTPSSSHATIMISEILADPPLGIEGDADGNGTRSSSGDEFVELFNNSLAPVDLTGWRLSDAAGIRHLFDGVIQAQGYYTVFGSSASTGTLSLNNSGDTISLFDADNVLVDQVVYDDLANQDQSIVRMGGDLFLHTQFSSALFSPNAPHQPDTAAVPEPVTYMSFLGGILMAYRAKHG